MTGSPPAWDSDGIPAEERAEHFVRAERLFAAALDRRELPHGISVRLPPDLFAEVARFVDNERRCCPFLGFTIQVPPGEGALTLRLTGPEGVREFLAAELDISRTS